MDAVELIKKVRKIDLKMRGLTSDILTGGYHSAFKGRGMAFDEVRAYQPGDDVRTIDWNVTARTGEPFIKKYEEERELTVLLLIDVSGSAFTGAKGTSKHEQMVEVAALIALSAIKNHDKVGLLLFADKPLFFLPPRTGHQHLLRLIREILHFEAGKRGTNLHAALTHAFNLYKQRSICFVLSDFLATGFETPLKVLAGRHDVIGVQFVEPLEQQVPNGVGILHIQDPETGTTTLLDTSDSAALNHYQQNMVAGRNQAKSIFERNGADFMCIQSDAPYLQTLLQFFQKHGKRR